MEPAPAPEHVLLYDADCGFCTRALDRILRWDRAGRLRAVPIQDEEGQRLLTSVPAAARLDSWHLVDPAGGVHSGGAAGPRLLRLLPGGRVPAAMLAAFPAITDVAYRWIAAHRDLLGRFLVLVLAVTVVGAGCGTTVQEGSELTVYASLPLSGPEGEDGRETAAGIERALEQAGEEAGGVPIRLEVLDDTAPAAGDGARRWTQTQIAANARTATQDSTTVAFIGELSSDATRVSAPITNEAGVLQLSPGLVERDLLAEPGGNDVPSETQPAGERTLGTVFDRDVDAELRPGPAVYGAEAMALILDSIDRAEDPLDRASVNAAFYATQGRDSELGTYTIDPIGQAAFSDEG